MRRMVRQPSAVPAAVWCGEEEAVVLATVSKRVALAAAETETWGARRSLRRAWSRRIDECMDRLLGVSVQAVWRLASTHSSARVTGKGTWRTTRVTTKRRLSAEASGPWWVRTRTRVRRRFAARLRPGYSR